MLDLDIGVSNKTKKKIDLNCLKKAALLTTKELYCGKKQVEISLVFVGEKKIRELNKKYRKKNKITDVLSFSFFESGDNFLSDKLNLGEIFVCVSYAEKNARKKGVSLKKELALLVVHGVVHLFGIDHERSEKEYKKTEKIQNKILSLLFKK